MSTPFPRTPSPSRGGLLAGALPSLLLGACLAAWPFPAAAADVPPSLFSTYPSWCDERSLEHALARGADVNETLPNGTTVLDMVLANGDADDVTVTVRLLLDHGARTGSGECSPALALTRLVAGGATPEELDAAMKAMGGRPGSLRLANGFTPYLWAAALSPSYRHLQVFHANGTPVDEALPAAPDAHRETGDDALAIAAMSNTSTDVARGLSQVLPLNSHSEQHLERSPLMLACALNPSLEVAQTLMEMGARVEASDIRLNTAFLLAAARPGASKLLEGLASRGADIEVQNSDEETALVLAARVNPDVAVIRTLVGLDVPDDAIALSGDNALTAAVRSNPSPEVIRELLATGLVAEVHLGEEDRPVLATIDARRRAWLEEQGLLAAIEKQAEAPAGKDGDKKD